MRSIRHILFSSIYCEGEDLLVAGEDLSPINNNVIQSIVDFSSVCRIEFRRIDVVEWIFYWYFKSIRLNFI